MALSDLSSPGSVSDALTGPSTEAYSSALPLFFQHIGGAFGQLFAGNLPGFFQSFFHADVIVVVGVFFFAYLFFHYVLRKTLIRDAEHKKTANGISVGFALVAIVQDNVFRFIAGFFTSGFVIMLGILVVFMVMNIFNLGRGATFKSGAAAAKAGSEYYRASKDSTKAAHDLLNLRRDIVTEQRLRNRERGSIKKVKAELDTIHQDERGVIERLQQMAQVTSRLASVGTEGPNAAYRENLMNEARALSSTIVTDESHIKQLDAFLKQAIKFDGKEIKIEHQEEKLEGHIETRLRDYLAVELRHHVDSSQSDNEIKDAITQDKRLEANTKRVHEILVRKKDLLKQMDSLDRDALSQEKNIHHYMDTYQRAMGSNDIDSALSAVQKALRDNQRVLMEEQKLEQFQQQWQQLLADEEHVDYQIKQLVSTMQNEVQKNRGKI